MPSFVPGTGHTEANKRLHQAYIIRGAISTNQQIKMCIYIVKGATNTTMLSAGSNVSGVVRVASLRSGVRASGMRRRQPCRKKGGECSRQGKEHRQRPGDRRRQSTCEELK